MALSPQTFQLQQPSKHAHSLELSVTSVATDIDDAYFFDDSITELSAPSHMTVPATETMPSSHSSQNIAPSSSGLSQEDMKHLVSLHRKSKSLSDHPRLLLPFHVVGYCSADPLLTISEKSCTDTSAFDTSTIDISTFDTDTSTQITFDTDTSTQITIMTPNSDEKGTEITELNQLKKSTLTKIPDLQPSDTELYGGPKPYFIKRTHRRNATESQLNLCSIVSSKRMKQKREKHVLSRSKSSRYIGSPCGNDIGSPSSDNVGACSNCCTMNEEYLSTVDSIHSKI